MEKSKRTRRLTRAQRQARAIVVLDIVCPACGFNLNAAEDSVDKRPVRTERGVQFQCESCGALSFLDHDAVHDAQHDCLVLLGED